MHPVYDIPILNTHDAYRHVTDIRFLIKESVIAWMVEQGLPDDSMSNEWTVYEDWSQGTVCFFFADPNKAMIFKLAYA